MEGYLVSGESKGCSGYRRISHIYAKGYAAGEIKQCPFTFLFLETPVVAICAPGYAYAVMTSNIREREERGISLFILGIYGRPGS